MEEDVQQNIIKTAGDLFFRLGIRSVSIDDICRELGMSKKTFYVYFSSKDELVAQLLQSNIDYISQKAEQLLSQNDFKAWVRSFVKKQQEEKKDVRRVPQLVFDLQKYYPRQFQDYQYKAFLSEKEHIYRFLEKGIESGLVRADINKEYAAIFFAKVHTDMVADLEKLENNGVNMVALSREAMEIFVRGILSEEGMKIYNDK